LRVGAQDRAHLFGEADLPFPLRRLAQAGLQDAGVERPTFARRPGRPAVAVEGQEGRGAVRPGGGGGGGGGGEGPPLGGGGAARGGGGGGGGAGGRARPGGPARGRPRPRPGGPRGGGAAERPRGPRRARGRRGRGFERDRLQDQAGERVGAAGALQADE